MVKPICTVMVGLPALGKSTLIHKIKSPQTFIYSTDSYIEDQVRKGDYSSYDEAFEEVIEEATAYMDTELEKMINWKNDIIWDQTNLGIGKRRKILNKMKEAGYEVRCACILPPEAGWIDDQKAWKYRLEGRPGKTIPYDVLTKMVNGFTIPTIDEGFDKITFYNMHGYEVKDV
jgi:Arc/MetJ-type ribon-helix-helix transcriptional regulator